MHINLSLVANRREPFKQASTLALGDTLKDYHQIFVLNL